MTRVQGARVKPVDAAAATLVMGELGVHGEQSRQVRLQADVAVEKFGDADRTFFDENRGALRFYGQVWATVRL